ncbi:hypothetical protein RB601_004347 [Gaeumannomyces tritici]
MPRADGWSSRAGSRVPVRPSTAGAQQQQQQQQPQLQGPLSPLSPQLPDQAVSVLFCCLGNICRSTMAEGVFQSLTRTPQYKDRVGRIDSCGTAAYHTGEPPDSRTMETLRANGIVDYYHSARKVNNKDFDTFDYIFAMDRSNLKDLQQMKASLKRLKGQDSRAKVMLFGEFSGTGRVEVVSDPYYGGDDGFALTYQQAVRFSENFLKETFPDAAAEASPADGRPEAAGTGDNVVNVGGSSSGDS